VMSDEWKSVFLLLITHHSLLITLKAVTAVRLAWSTLA